MILTRQQALDIFRRRVSTRHYDPARKISAEDFAAILDFGRLSPSSVGSEPWKFLVIQNQGLREKIKPVAWGMQATIAEASHLVILLAKKHARYDSPFFSELMDRRGFPPRAARRRPRALPQLPNPRYRHCRRRTRPI